MFAHGYVSLRMSRTLRPICNLPGYPAGKQSGLVCESPEEVTHEHSTEQSEMPVKARSCNPVWKEDYGISFSAILPNRTWAPAYRNYSTLGLKDSNSVNSPNTVFGKLLTPRNVRTNTNRSSSITTSSDDLKGEVFLQNGLRDSDPLSFLHENYAKGTHEYHKNLAKRSLADGQCEKPQDLGTSLGLKPTSQSMVLSSPSISKEEDENNEAKYFELQGLDIATVGSAKQQQTTLVGELAIDSGAGLHEERHNKHINGRGDRIYVSNGRTENRKSWNDDDEWVKLCDSSKRPLQNDYHCLKTAIRAFLEGPERRSGESMVAPYISHVLRTRHANRKSVAGPLDDCDSNQCAVMQSQQWSIKSNSPDLEYPDKDTNHKSVYVAFRRSIYRYWHIMRQIKFLERTRNLKSLETSSRAKDYRKILDRHIEILANTGEKAISESSMNSMQRIMGHVRAEANATLSCLMRLGRFYARNPRRTRGSDLLLRRNMSCLAMNLVGSTNALLDVLRNVDTYAACNRSALGKEHALCENVIASPFKIPESVLRAAMNASPNSAASYWSFKLYRNENGSLPIIRYCPTNDSSNTVVQQFLGETVVGFDIEWKAGSTAIDGIKNNVSLIQVASQGTIALFHIAMFNGEDNIKDCVPLKLKQLLENPSIIKVGVAIKADCTRLHTYLGIECRGIFELSHLYKLVKFSNRQEDIHLINRRLKSLASQVQEHLFLPLKKNEVRTSDWHKRLTRDQMEYAASDAYAGLQLFHSLEAKRLATEPIPPRPCFAELNQPILLANGQSVEMWLKEQLTKKDATSPIEGVDGVPRSCTNQMD